MSANKNTTPVPLGLRLCQIAIPALAIPSAIGVAKFFSVADGVDGWTLQGVIAAAGFELTNVGMSILDVRRPALHQVAQRVRFWSVATAIALNCIAHYAQAVPELNRVDGVAAALALVASVPLALLYVKLAAFLHALAESDHAERDALALLRAELAKAREQLATKAAELASAAARLANLDATLEAERAQAREALAHAREAHAAELARVEAATREAREDERAELARVRDALARAEAEAREGRAALAAQVKEARNAERDAEQARAERNALRDRSRDALMRDAQRLAAAHGWGASEVGRALGWPESTVRGWISSTTAAAAD